MTEEEEGAEKGGEDIRSYAVKGLPDRVVDGVGTRGSGG